MNTVKSNKIVYWILTLLLMASLIGCNGEGPTENDDNTYQVSGLYVQDLNEPVASFNYSSLAMKVSKNGNGQNIVNGMFAGENLFFGTDSIYFTGFRPSPYRTPANYYLALSDSTYADSFTVSVPDSAFITSYNPDSITTYNTNNNGIVLDWTGAAGTSGYVIAVVKADAAYTGVGFSFYVTSLATSDFIPHDAFLDPLDNLDVGRYYIYVYSYTGSPDAALSAGLLPVPFPTQLADNISQGNISGRFGTVVVSRRVPIDVALI